MSEVSTKIDGNVAVVELNNPPNNHVSVGNMAALADAFEAMDKERNVRVVLLTSAGKNFCAGADLVGGNIANAPGTLYDQAVRLFSTQKPVVSAVQGAAVGAGLGLALVADHRVAAEDAKFAANFTKLGFHPGFGLTHTLPRLIGQTHASRMFLTGQRYKAQEVLPWGLVDKVVSLESLRDEAMALAREIAENAPLALIATRATLRAGLADAVRKQTDHEAIEQGKLRVTKDYAEGVRSVAERRVGNFTGE
jgi:enoyl-CoA hydratase/carnithine racemase